MDQNDHAHSGLPGQSPQDSRAQQPPTPSGSSSQSAIDTHSIPPPQEIAPGVLDLGSTSASVVEQPPPPYPADEQPSLPERNSRRARVDDEEDEEEQRQTNRQRMHPPPHDHNHSSNDHHYHPDMHAHAQQHREQQQQQQAQPQPHPQHPPLPFNRISFTVDILPTFGAAPGAAVPPPPPPAGNPQQPGPGRAVPPVFFEVRFPFPGPAQPADNAQGAAPAHTPNAPHDDFVNAFFNALQAGGMPWGQFPGFAAEEPEDPGRARRLLSGLEQVPEGLVKRMERVGALEGEQVVCAICFDSLLKSDGEGSAEDKMEVETEQSSSPSSSSAEPEHDVSEEDRKADAELDGKAVVLPCAHVFHASCLRPWFTRPHRTTCPTCRFDIDPDSLTYVPPTRRPRPRQPAPQTSQNAPATGAPPQAQPQVAEQAAVPPSATADAAPQQPGAGTGPRLPLDPGRDMPYIVFDVSMLLPIPQPPRAPGESNAQPPQPAPGPQTGFFGPAPPPGAVPGSQAAPISQPGMVRMGREQLEQLMLGRPVTLNSQAQAQAAADQPRPQPAAQPQPLPQAQARQPQTGPRPFWQPFPLGPTHLGVHHGPAPQANGGNGGNSGGFGSLFANLFSRGRGAQQQTGANAAAPQAQAPPAPQPQPQAAPAPAAQPPQNGGAHAHPPLPSFDEFMHFVGLGPEVQQGQAQGQAHQPPAPGAAPEQPQPHHHVHPHDGPFMDGVRDLATSVLEQIFPTGLFVPLPPRPPHNAAHPPPPPPGPIPFHIPSQPRAPQPPPEKRQWTPPPPPGPTLRERVERKEREHGLRCSDISCGLGPSDEDPLPVVDPRTIRQVAIRPLKGQDVGRDRVCEHTFHPACLVSAERVAGWDGADQKREVEDGEEEVEVSCPVCRAVGIISREDWDEGACALA